MPLTAHAASLAQSVDTRIGTDVSPSLPAFGVWDDMGNVQPSAGVPFGMVQWGPDTRFDEDSSYWYGDSRIQGFSLTHISGPGCAVAGEISFLPFSATGHSDDEDFDHADEQAQAGYYSVGLAGGIQVELTSTARTGFGRFTFPELSQPRIRIDSIRTATDARRGEIRQIDDTHLSGWVDGGGLCEATTNYRVYYFMETAVPISTFQASGGVAVLGFEPETRQVEVKVGISYVSEANAALNLRTEASSLDFDAAKLAAQASWEDHLGGIQLQGESERERRIFYTALYHTLLHPNLTSDVNGEYTGFDRAVHRVSEVSGQQDQYANFSGWDVYRSEIQLLAFLFPRKTSDIVQSLVNEGSQCGALPQIAINNDETGVMVGDPGPIIVSSAYAFGAKNFDTASALALMQKSGGVPGTHCNSVEIRPGLADYLHLHYVPMEYSLFSDNGSASVTLEYASSDFAISRFADALGVKDVASAYLARSGYWRSNFDPATRRIRPKFADGKWMDHFDETVTDGFIEGNSAQYTWMVPFDIGGLVAGIGGAQATNERLDEYFQELNAGPHAAHLWIGNEPSLNAPWIYNWTGAPEKTQRLVGRILNESFTDQAGGLPGNDDLGETSSWLVWATLGLYPAIPGEPGFTVSRPRFPRIEIAREGAAPIVLETTAGASADDVIQKAWLGEKPLDKSWLSLDALIKARHLRFELGPEGGRWATGRDDGPPSFTK